MKKTIIALATLLAFTPMAVTAQHEGFKTREQAIHEAAYWTGERFANGDRARPSKQARIPMNEGVCARRKSYGLRE